MRPRPSAGGAGGRAAPALVCPLLHRRLILLSVLSHSAFDLAESLPNHAGTSSDSLCVPKNPQEDRGFRRIGRRIGENPSQTPRGSRWVPRALIPRSSVSPFSPRSLARVPPSAFQWRWRPRSRVPVSPGDSAWLLAHEGFPARGGAARIGSCPNSREHGGELRGPLWRPGRTQRGGIACTVAGHQRDRQRRPSGWHARRCIRGQTRRGGLTAGGQCRDRGGVDGVSRPFWDAPFPRENREGDGWRRQGSTSPVRPAKPARGLNAPTP